MTERITKPMTKPTTKSTTKSTMGPQGRQATGRTDESGSDDGSSALNRRAVRTIALFEAFKGLLVLSAGLGLMSLVHHDLRDVAEDFIRHARFDPDGKYPAIFLQWVDHLNDASMWSLLAIAAAYVVLRFAEAYGLWHGRAWGDWLGTLSGALYFPVEIRHLMHKPSWATACLLTFNVVVVAFLVRRMLVRRAAEERAALGLEPPHLKR